MSKKRAKNHRDTELNDVRAVMSTPQGRRLMFRLLVLSGKDTSQFTGHNSYQNYYEGKRALGLTIEAELKIADIKNYFLMLKEAHMTEEQLKIELKNEREELNNDMEEENG